jgi:hypothetical protein
MNILGGSNFATYVPKNLSLFITYISMHIYIYIYIYIYNSVGSLGKYPDEKDVRGVVVTNCTLRNADNGVRIKTWGGSPPSQASNILFQDIIMDNVKRPIIIDQTYGSKSNSVRFL